MIATRLREGQDLKQSIEKLAKAMDVSDKDGKVIGGHVKEGCEVHTTVELVLAVEDELVFDEENDPNTCFGGLGIRSK